jgi:hypothetical protein
MSSFAERAPGDSGLGRPNVAHDGGVSVVDQDGYSPAGSPNASDQAFGPYAGPFGLGQQAALGSAAMTGMRNARPYRRLISTHAVYRREVFAPPITP